MTLEQRIGRIDRIGQARQTIDVINLFYADTAEYDAYRIMGNRMKAIEENVGPYRPIMQPNVETGDCQRPPEGGERSRHRKGVGRRSRPR